MEDAHIALNGVEIYFKKYCYEIIYIYIFVLF